jgi:hypothetical protein
MYDVTPAMSTAADVNNMNDEVSLADWSWLTASLTMNIFQIVTPFDEPFASLEILQRTLRDHAIFTGVLRI